jgi:hypothetical protein
MSVNRSILKKSRHIGIGLLQRNLSTLLPFQRLSADYSQPHSDNFGNFLRRLVFTLASTFLYEYHPLYVVIQLFLSSVINVNQ